MEQKFPILLLEDSSTDAEIIQRFLMKGKVAYEFRLANDEKSFTQALEDFSPRVILSDNSMPGFNAVEALQITRRRSRYIPFIMVTGTVSEEFAATIIKMGADDYILKDRIARLPAAIEAALKQRRAEKQITDYEYALENGFIVSAMNQDGYIQYANENFCNISGYTAEELIGRHHSLLYTDSHAVAYIKNLWATIAGGQIWKGECCNKTKDGTLYWMDATIIPFVNEKGVPYQYVMMCSNITEKKKLETALFEQYTNEQLKITATALDAQEKERNAIGEELHDNVNQILLGTRLLLSVIKDNPAANVSLLGICAENLEKAIEENRKLAHALVIPDFHSISLAEQLNNLSDTMLITTGIDADVDTTDLNEDLIDDGFKLSVYRIAQEQCSNIIKYAGASAVNIVLSSLDNVFTMLIADDGKGMEPDKKASGIGLKNIKARLSILKGSANITTEPAGALRLK